MAITAVGCGRTITGSGRVVTPTGAVAPVSRLGVASSFVASVSPRAPVALTLHRDDNLIDPLDVAVSDGTLHLALKPNTSVRDATLRADVTIRSLSAIDGSGASRIHLVGELGGVALRITLSGASRVDGTIHVD